MPNKQQNPIILSSDSVLSDSELKKLKNLDDVSSFVKKLVAPTIQAMLEGELQNHLGYPKHSVLGNRSGNNRNGHYKKTIKTGFGKIDIRIPRDRNGTYSPVAVKKHQTRASDIEERIISMYAKGMTTRDIHSHMEDIYGVDVSAEMVSMITDKVMPLVEEWQSRPLDSLYPVVYLDALYFKVRDSGRIINRAAYTALGINLDGKKDILGIWAGESEGAKFWAGVLNEIRNRGVNDILIACVDGLKGFSEAISTVYPETTVQQCIIHQVRNTTKYVSFKDRKKLCESLRAIYSAPTEKAGLQALKAAKENWPKYAPYLRSWEDKWNELSAFYAYPEEVRRIIYTTNAVEGVHRQFRKVTKTTSIFPHEESLLKLLWLAQRDITKRWNLPVRNWGIILGQFTLMFPEKIKL